MDTRKITLIATIAAIALVAVGIGYAYTAMTENSGNTVSSTYMVVTPNAAATGETDGAYTGNLSDYNITYSTKNIAGTVTYELASDSDNAPLKYKTSGNTVASTTAAGSIKMFKIGEQKITLAPATGTDLPNYIKFNLTLKANAGTMNTTDYDFYYAFAKYSNSSVTEDGSAVSVFGTAMDHLTLGGSTATDYEIYLYAALKSESPASAPSAQVITGATFVYTIESSTAS